MNVTDLPAALGVAANQDNREGLAHILEDSGLDPGDLVPAMYDPSNIEVLNLLRANASSATISATWDRLHPHESQATIDQRAALLAPAETPIAAAAPLSDAIAEDAPKDVDAGPVPASPVPSPSAESAPEEAVPDPKAPLRDLLQQSLAKLEEL